MFKFHNERICFSALIKSFSTLITLNTYHPNYNKCYVCNISNYTKKILESSTDLNMKMKVLSVINVEIDFIKTEK